MKTYKSFYAFILGLGLYMPSQAAIYLGQDSQGYDWTFMEKRLVNKGYGIKESWAFQTKANTKRKALYSFNCRNQTIATLAIYDYRTGRGTDKLVHSWQNPNPGISAEYVRTNTFGWQMYQIAC